MFIPIHERPVNSVILMEYTHRDFHVECFSNKPLNLVQLLLLHMNGNQQQEFSIGTMTITCPEDTKLQRIIIHVTYLSYLLRVHSHSIRKREAVMGRKSIIIFITYLAWNFVTGNKINKLKSVEVCIDRTHIKTAHLQKTGSFSSSHFSQWTTAVSQTSMLCIEEDRNQSN